MRPGNDILSKGLPDKTGGDEVAGGMAARMGDVVGLGEHGAAESGGN